MVAVTSLVPVSPQEQYYSGGLRARYQLDGQKLTKPHPHSGPFAEIDYEFDVAKFRRRTEKVLSSGPVPKTLPKGFPLAVHGPQVWSTTDFLNEDSYVFHLGDTGVAEIARAMRYFRSLGKTTDQVSKRNFPLPTLGPVLERLRDVIYNGRGFSIIRGLDVDSYTSDDLTTIYLGMTSYIADRRGKQDQRGSMIMHVINKDDEDAVSNVEVEKPFHNDMVCDVLCLLTRSCAATGGRSILASAWTVYNELAATRPDIIHTLSRSDWPLDTCGRFPAYYSRALLYCQDNKIIFNISRRMLTGKASTDPRTEGIPGLTEAQAEAIDAVHYVASKHEIRTTMLKGDIRFLNNMGLFHRRESFADDGATQRHLMRLWLHNSKYCWSLPPPLQLAWDRIFDDSERDEHWDVDPIRVNGRILRISASCD